MTTTIKRSSAPVEWIKMESLSVDSRLQRRLKPGWVQARVDRFDPDWLGVLTVSLRANGRHIVLDGLHRVELLKLAGFGPEQLIPCTVLRDKSFEQEAGIFLGANDRVAVSAFDQFKQRINKGDPESCAIYAVLKSLRLRLDEHASAEGGVSAVGALVAVYRGVRRTGTGQNAEILAATLNVLIEAYGRSGDVFQGSVIHGVGLVLLRDIKVIDLGSLIQKLAKRGGGYNGLIGDARTAKAIHGGGVPHNLAGVVVALYNKGRRGDGLEPWWK